MEDCINKNINKIFIISRSNDIAVYRQKIYEYKLNDNEKCILLLYLYLNSKKDITFCSYVFGISKENIIRYFKDLNVFEKTESFKICTECYEVKPRTLDFFNKDIQKSDGFSPKCISCRHNYVEKNHDIILEKLRTYGALESTKKKKSDYFKEFRVKNKEKLKENITIWKQENKEHVKNYRQEYYNENRDKILEKHKINYDSEQKSEYNKRYRTEINPGKCAEDRAARRAAIINATPPWANRNELIKIYKQARLMENEDGIKRHVDHIIPLNHPLVCGLHIPCNLQILEAKENLDKSNKFEPYII
jgi:hypothetical protein